MTIQAQAVEKRKPFAAAQAKFLDVVGDLGSEALRQMSHNEAEEHVLTQGREVMRLLLQGYLDHRSTDEAVAVVGADGVARTHKRHLTARLKSVVGEVKVPRILTAINTMHGMRGYHGLAPLDAALNMPSGQHSLGVQRRIAEEVARGSYDEATAALERHTGIHVAKHQAETIAAEASKDFEAFYVERRVAPASAQPTGDAVAGTKGIIVITTDAKGIVMRPDALREGTRNAAAKFEQKLEKRVSRGEKRNRKRMAQVASVYAIEPFIRQPEDVVADMKPVRSTPLSARPRPVDKRVWASVMQPVNAVIDAAFDEAKDRDPKRSKNWVVLVDGNKPQLDAVQARANRDGIKPTVIIDIIHVLEYLWKAAWCFFIEGNREVETWVRERFFAILRGRASLVAAGMRRAATRQELSDDARKNVDICANYLLKYKAYLRYDQYLAAGYPIATGVIEGACRYLIKDRMDLTGARWGLAGAEAVLRLRALRASGDFDEYWKFHQAREFERNHASSYADSKIPSLTSPTAKAPVRHLRAVK